MAAINSFVCLSNICVMFVFLDGFMYVNESSVCASVFSLSLVASLKATF